MALFDDYGAPQFGLNDCKIAAWNSTGSYGSAVDVPSVQAMNTTLRVITAELVGDDKITASASRAIGAQFVLRWGSVDLRALEVMLGIAATSSVASPNAVKQLKVEGGDRMPYFGIAGVALAEEGSGDFVVFLPKCKIMSDVTLVQLEYGTFAIPEMTVAAVSDDTYGAVNLIERQTAIALVLPPANIT